MQQPVELANTRISTGYYAPKSPRSLLQRPSQTQHWPPLGPLPKKNRQLVADEPVEFEKEPVEVRDFRRITDHFRGIHRRINLLKWPKAVKPEDVNLWSGRTNRQLGTDEPVEFEKTTGWRKFKTTAGKLPIFLEEFIEYTPQFKKGKPVDVHM